MKTSLHWFAYSLRVWEQLLALEGKGQRWQSAAGVDNRGWFSLICGSTEPWSKMPLDPSVGLCEPLKCCNACRASILMGGGYVLRSLWIVNFAYTVTKTIVALTVAP